jgi:methionyl-tRNA formyltransferase
MRIVFCGTPEFAVPSLRRLLGEPGFSVEAVVTQPDRPRGRGGIVSASPVKEAALEAGVRVYQPERIKSESSLDFFGRIAPDAVVIIAYGQIIPQALIDIPRLGWINLHASLLPKYRGAAPIHWVIAGGETMSGLTTMRIDAGMDTGPILLQTAMDIAPDETAPQLALRMSREGAALVVESLRKLESGEISVRAQDSSQATYAPRLKKEDGRIDWTLTARQIYNRIRGFAPWPGAYTSFRGKTVHVWGRPADNLQRAAQSVPGQLIAESGAVRVACGENTFLELEEARMEGRKRVNAREFAMGARLAAGDRFGT